MNNCSRINDFISYNTYMQNYLKYTEEIDNFYSSGKGNRFSPEVIALQKKLEENEKLADLMLKRLADPKNYSKKCTGNCNCIKRNNISLSK